jgi:hypothetical protein
MAGLVSKPAAEEQGMRVLVTAMGLEVLQQHGYSRSMRALRGLNLVHIVTGWIKFYFTTSYKSLCYLINKESMYFYF